MSSTAAILTGSSGGATPKQPGTTSDADAQKQKMRLEERIRRQKFLYMTQLLF